MSADLEETVERCRAGDGDAWTALVGATLPTIYRLCASYSRSAAEAEDLTQEFYVKLWENLHKYRPGSNFNAWAWRVARNMLTDAHRRCRRERQAAWLDPEVLDRLPSDEDPHRQAVRRERLAMVRAALGQIDESLAELIILRDLTGMAYQDIAALLELPLGTVKSRLNRARLELATAVRRRLDIRSVDDRQEVS